MWRSATPAVVKVGATDKANVGWAIYSCGVASSFCLNSSISHELALGPINMPYPPDP
ncbi:Uncharacterised protein [Acinetobacter baumannii]|nr:Uncharacterised protein [Acinetobacter baumannii]